MSDSEKQELPAYQPSRLPPKPSRWRIVHKVAVLTLVIGNALPYLWKPACNAVEYCLKRHGHQVREIKRWEDVPSSADLEFHGCFGGNLCARLEVPLDWNSTDPNESAKAKIAIIVKRANVKVTDPRYGGVLLWNPGGPGGSGTAAHEGLGTRLSGIADTPGEKHFDILSFDPRGVGNTEPGIVGFEDPVLLQSWAKQQAAIGYDLDDPGVFHNTWARLRLWSAMLTQSNTKAKRVEEHAGRFVSTPVVARDMVEIIEKYGAWRETVAKAELGSRDDPEALAALRRTKYQPGEEKLNYWGFSYGTVLGQVFAILQPHRVQRMVLDGTVDLEDWVQGRWSKNLQDVEAITQSFAYECAMAGPEKCSIAHWAAPDQQPQRILWRLYPLIEALRETPLTGIRPDTGLLAVTSHSDIVSLLFGLWYVPVGGFGLAANILNGISKGDNTLDLTKVPISCLMPAPFHDPSAALPAIHCSDGPDILNTTKSEFREYISKLRQQSPMFGDILSALRLSCTNYNVRPKWRFEGPFTAKTPVGILFTDQSLDPITPMRNGEHAATLFPGAGVVENKGYGHCSIIMPNLCGMMAIRKYFLDGETQQEKIVCPQEISPFDSLVGLVANNVTVQQQEMLDTAWAASDAWADLRRMRSDNMMYL